VSYRRADLLAQCLTSVAQHLPDSEVHVWDNGSDGSQRVRAVAADWPQVHWTFSAENVGFARAVNALAERTTDGDLLLLNPDAVLVSDLRACRRALAAARNDHLAVAAVAPEVIDPERGQPWDNARRNPGAWRWLVSASGYAQRLRALPCSDLYPGPPTGQVGYLSGACLLISRAAWTDVGPFDER
jgi:GT2 family glycosyltransferase